jgi:hypothetical protein
MSGPDSSFSGRTCPQNAMEESSKTHLFQASLSEFSRQLAVYSGDMTTADELVSNLRHRPGDAPELSFAVSWKFWWPVVPGPVRPGCRNQRSQAPQKAFANSFAITRSDYPTPQWTLEIWVYKPLS